MPSPTTERSVADVLRAAREPLKEAKDAVKRLQREMREATTAREWALASTLAHELSERLSDLAGCEQ